MKTLNPFAIYRNWQQKKSCRRALYALDDKQLHDIGIMRTEVEDVACGRMPRGASHMG
jgi:uncharacterized protein YjiS (DUF1127 family)